MITTILWHRIYIRFGVTLSLLQVRDCKEGLRLENTVSLSSVVNVLRIVKEESESSSGGVRLNELIDGT